MYEMQSSHIRNSHFSKQTFPPPVSLHELPNQLIWKPPTPRKKKKVVASSCLLCRCRVNKFPPHQMLPLCQWICTRCPLVLVLMHWPQQYWTARDNSNLLKSKKKKVTTVCTRSLLFPAVYDDTQTIQTILFS